MIIFQKQLSPDISIAVWQIAENEEYFWSSLRLLAEDEAKIRAIKLQRVRLQKLACRAALAELLGNPEIGITYSENGQPLLKKHHISFAHTKTTVAVALSNIPTGIDIEELSPRILPLYSRFMSGEEIADCNLNNLQELYYYWCAKEAMYKWFAEKNLDFTEDLKVYKNDNKGIVCNKYELQLTSFNIENKLIILCV
ncbi:MAG: 4'-phosphopantetheinyl transferase superfamily protein [Bacteroidetes bacterium]|nr:4'-phosphopantetheinyl transferase superfamily protein [Bacteroidota bacterium]MCL1968660.1 4'-phosphopantetheinyl transferase superfamily protein [Bacteroidota bacterium]